LLRKTSLLILVVLKTIFLEGLWYKLVEILPVDRLNNDREGEEEDDDDDGV